ncbi:MAG: hypothetical protein AAFP76_16395 [Bacteroidota bacterium]
MKEEEVKKLMQKSVMSTSEDFTDRLMHRIETEDVAETKVTWSLGRVWVAVLILMTGIGYMCYRLISNASLYPTVDLRDYKIPMLLVPVLAFLFTLRKLLLWREMEYGLKRGV